jgi:hypothetical protein
MPTINQFEYPVVMENADNSKHYRYYNDKINMICVLFCGAGTGFDEDIEWPVSECTERLIRHSNISVEIIRHFFLYLAYQKPGVWQRWC